MNSVRRLLGEQDVHEILKKLDRLAHQEARVTGLQIIEVIYDLVQDMRVIMGGKQTDLHYYPQAVKYVFF